ncbi:hypothetical protein G7Y89_g294 [Cudoniella acicularis]|uniref:Uncharacterized protein n=1 Tax=Cudoniella acicularis TaxID=354080 RepID=A0A8H4RXG8_9HELO|nr:hypothetical protein G7Y89_g294 [Cudoniella acicularis]
MHHDEDLTQQKTNSFTNRRDVRERRPVDSAMRLSVARSRRGLDLELHETPQVSKLKRRWIIRAETLRCARFGLPNCPMATPAESAPHLPVSEMSRYWRNLWDNLDGGFFIWYPSLRSVWRLLSILQRAWIPYIPGRPEAGPRAVLIVWRIVGASRLLQPHGHLFLPDCCQALLVFTTGFDQMARVVMEQFFLWSLNQGTKVTAQQLVLQGILVIRMIVGGLLVGFTRPDFAPVCVARTSVLPISIVVLALDVIIIGVSIIRVTRRESSKPLMLSILGFATSVPMILGIPTIALIVRTTVPASGLVLLVGVVLVFQAPLMATVAEEGTTPEAQSPFIMPTPPSREIFRGNGGNGSPISGNNYTNNGSLFVVNPSLTPRDSPTTKFQGNYQGDTKGFTKLSIETTVRTLGEDETSQMESKNGPGYRGSSGVFPSILATPMQTGGQAAMAPQIKPAALDRARNMTAPAVPPPVVQQKRSLFNWSKPAAQTTVRSLKISTPVMSIIDESTIQPFARMQTIDLATAAVNERERREGAVARSRLEASRPAPAPPSLPAQEGLRRSISVKRKDPPSRPSEPMPSIPASNASGRSIEAANGSTTSASLSPGRDEVRRRSPRNANSFNNNTTTNSTLQRKGTIGLPSNPRVQRATLARETETPKAQTVMFVNEIVYDNPAMVSQIINGAPDMYASARGLNASEKLDLYNTGLKSSNSILHRPRPIKRDSEKDRALFPSQPSPNHKRSKSGSSIATRKSILRSHPGSPTDLPPLPPPPTSAQKLRRLLPNDTKSMTFDEKIELLFPAPPGIIIPKRRSSVPALPQIPSALVADVPRLKSPKEEEQQSQRASKRSTIASFGFDLKSEPASPAWAPNRTKEHQAYRFSVNTYRNIADEVGETWIPGIPSTDVDVRNSVRTSPKRESAYDARKSAAMTNSGSNASSHDSTTYWGSIHSEIPPVDLSKARQNARSTFIQRTDIPSKDDESRPLPLVPQLEYNDTEEIMAIMLDPNESRNPILSQPTENEQSFLLNREESLSEGKTVMSLKGPNWHRRIGDDLPTFSERKSIIRPRKMPPPTPLLLSKNGRVATVVVRAAEPSPMDSPERAIQEIQEQLKRFEDPNRGSVGSIIRNLPNASDIDSAKDDRGGRFRLLENLEKEMGQQEDQWQQMQSNLDRDSVSVIMTPQASVPSEGDLSRESSQRSNRTPSRVSSRRARIRSSMTVRSKGEDSVSTTSTQSSDNSSASVWQQRLAEAQVEYLEKAPALLREKSVNFLSVSKSHQLGSPTPPESVDSDTDIEAEERPAYEPLKYLQSFAIAYKEPASLWQMPVSSPRAAAGRMWNPPYEVSTTISISEPPAKNVRPCQRYEIHALTISSSNLWTKPRSSEQSRPVVSLWGSKLVRPRSIVTRRVTQRPQRKSKRVTFLPDIVESPVPLPNKRDTLGIFQFPWGEQSDSAVYQPAFDPALLGHPMINANLEARSRQLEPESDDYSSSFFDDYDEDLDDEDMDPESDDDFDETTLWEIASLLKPTDVPSKSSLLPLSRKATKDIIEDYDEESGSEEEAGSNTFAKAPIQKFPIQPLAVIGKDPQLWTAGEEAERSVLVSGLPQPDESTWRSLVPSTDGMIRMKPRTSELLPTVTSNALWKAKDSGVISLLETAIWGVEAQKQSSDILVTASLWKSTPEVENRRGSGLFTLSVNQAVVQATQANPAALSMIKVPRKVNSALPSLSTSSLWSANLVPSKDVMWITKVAANNKGASSGSLKKMWAPTRRESRVVASGLFMVDRSKSDYRMTTQQPAAIAMTCKPRTRRAPMSQLESTELWSLCNGAALVEHHWITESSVRPESPSVYSSASSGQSSPASDTSSVRSTSTTDTKASSLWGAIGSAVNSTKPSWWESKSAKKSPSRSPVDDPKYPSRIPIRQSPVKPLEPVMETPIESRIPAPVNPMAPFRESRVLVSRDLFEAKALALSSTPVRKLRPVTISKPIATLPLRQQHRPVIALRADWDAALAEAIAAGTPKRLLTRPTATKVDWENALASAIMSSKLQLQRPNASPDMWKAALQEAISRSIVPATSNAQRYDPSVLHPVFFTEKLVSSAQEVHPAALGYVTTSHYDSSVLHPVFFTEKLVSNAQEIHPAATGYVSSPSIPAKTSRYDPSVRHPVFFTENLASSSADVHPVALGYSTKTKKDSLWAPSATSGTRSVAALWSKDNSFKRDMPTLSAFDESPVRKAPIVRAHDLPTLESSTFWSPPQKIASKRNWLEVKTVQPQMWKPTPSIEAAPVAALWSKDNPSKAHVSTEFVKLEESTSRKVSVRGLDLPTLESSSFWQPTHYKISERNWLEVRAVQSCMWSPPTTIVAPRTGALWSKSTIPTLDTPLVFARFNREDTLRKPTIVRALDLPVLESSNFWQPTEKVTVERDWLAPRESNARTWTRSASAEVIEDRNLWSAPATPVSLSPGIFAHLKMASIKKTSTPRPSALPCLNSSTLFERGSDQKSDGTHSWLHSTSNLAEFNGPAMTSFRTDHKGLIWSAPPAMIAAKADTTTKMWGARNVTVQSPTILFQNPHGAPWDRKKRQPTKVKSIESTEMWRPSRDIPQSPRNWLVTRRVSKVEFRY